MRHASTIIALLFAVLTTACDNGPTDPFEPLPREVRAFLQADTTLGVRTSNRIALESPEVALYRISYGPPLDCPSGCFFAEAVVLQAAGRVGWVNYLEPAPNAAVFRFQLEDSVRFTPPLLNELRRNDIPAYFAVAFMLVCSPNTASTLRERILRETPTIAPPSFCPEP